DCHDGSGRSLRAHPALLRQSQVIPGKRTRNRETAATTSPTIPQGPAKSRGRVSHMLRSSAAVAAVAACALALSAASGQAQPRRIQVGTLTCSLSASVGLIVGSQ